MLPRLPALALALAATCAVVGCGGGPPSPPERPNLVLVTLDTVRADRIGCYGYGLASTPGIDRLARDGVVAEQAVAVAPLTLPSHASLLTGLAPPRHGVHDNADYRLPASETTLAEHLARLGYRTAASVGAAVLSSRLGIAQGFESYGEPRIAEAGRPTGGGVGFVEIAERGAKSVTDDALAALDRVAGEPFFLWVHYFDPHADYAPPEPWRSRFTGRLYDGEIAYTDDQLVRILDALSSRGLDDRTLVVVTSDHGESLGEHGETTHGLFVYDATIRVPWIARFPAVLPAGARYGGLLSGIDLVPSVLSLMGLPPLPGTHGTDHAPGLRSGTPVAAPPAYGESLLGERAYGWAPLRSLRSLDEKYIEAPVPEFYRLADDPGEERNLAADRFDDVRRWSTRLEDAVAEFGASDLEAARPSTAAERAVLETLGYVGGSAGGARTGPRPDPKAMIAAHETYLRAQRLVALAKLPEGTALLNRVLEDDPANPAALSLLGSVRFATGGAQEGLAALEESVRLSPGVFENRSNLANAYHESGRWIDAVREYEAALRIRPGDGPTLRALGGALLAGGDAARAAEAFRAALGEGASEGAVRSSLGAALADAGDLAAAERELRAAVAAEPGRAEAWNKLGVVVERSGRVGEAVPLYDRALEVDPSLPDALFNRGKHFLREGRIEEGSRLAERLVAEHPEYDQGWLLVANARAARGDRALARDALRVLLDRPGVDPRLRRAVEDTVRKIGS
jgi:arylsulfatase A-like enzyme/tetratricopeptide (TPR) repeat protein